MLKICLVVWKSEPRYAYKRYAYKKTCMEVIYSLSCKISTNFWTI